MCVYIAHWVVTDLGPHTDHTLCDIGRHIAPLCDLTTGQMRLTDLDLSDGHAH